MSSGWTLCVGIGSWGEAVTDWGRRVVRAIGVLGLVAATAALHAYPAEIENIPPGQYVPVALQELQRAKASIHLYMYVIALPSSRQGSMVHRLVDALVEAQRRGVAVTVVLDQNIDWVDGHRGSVSTTEKNAAAAVYLRDRGIAVAFDDEAVYTHAKVLIVDHATVLVGSTNWTEAALTRNVEGTVLVRSPALAQALLAQFAGVARASRPAPERPTIRVPEALLTSPHRLGRMVRDHDERALDLFLLLCRADPRSDTAVVLTYAQVVDALDFRREVQASQRQTVRNLLSRLQNRYGLITYQAPAAAQDLVVRVSPAPDGDPAVTVPAAYWEWGWDRRLTFRGKVMYLLSQMYAARSPFAPTWSWSQEDLAARHGLSVAFVNYGLMDLRRQNLIEVEPGALTPARFGDRHANRYTPNPLYDPRALDHALAALEIQYGKAPVRRAKGYAAAVHEDHDVRAITRLMALEREFGQAVVRRAVAKVGAMNGSNPKKTVGYLIRVIQGMGKE